MGFKSDLANADKNIKKVDLGGKNTPKLKEASSPKYDKDELDKAYTRGYKDMKKLLDQFSLTFCRQFVFVMGFGRKSEDSDQKLKSYCAGFNDALGK